MRSCGAWMLLVAAPLCGQMIAGPITVASPVQAKGGGSVTGHVYCADTHLPARLAQVTLRRIRGGEDQKPTANHVSFSVSFASTDMDGAYTLSHVAPGQYLVDVQLPGYIAPSAKVDSKDLNSTDPDAIARVVRAVDTVRVQEGESARQDITLERGGAVSGHVLFEDGTPAANVTVTVARLNPNNGTQGGVVSFNAFSRTDDRGTFRMSGLQPDTYLVQANVNLPARQRGGLESAEENFGPFRNVRVYAPSALHRAEAQKVQIGFGDEVNGLEIRLQLSSLHAIRGTVPAVQASGKASVVMLQDELDGTTMRAARIQKDGSFELTDVPDGTYTLRRNDLRVPVTVKGKDVDDVVVGTAATN